MLSENGGKPERPTFFGVKMRQSNGRRNNQIRKEELIKKRLSLPADFNLDLISRMSISPSFDLSSPLSRNTYRQSLADIGFGRLSSYQKLDKLGEGAYATVFKGRSRLTNNLVALKEIRLEAEEGFPCTAIREVSLLRGLKHNNIVTLHDCVPNEKSLTLVFEYVQRDLKQLMDDCNNHLSAHNIKLYLFQLLRGLSYCHKRRILHRDLKPQNLLINDKGELKLADFGLARSKSVPSHTYSHEVVTLWYRPPDVLLGSTDYSCSLDIWGVGCIFIEMVAGQPAFPGVQDSQDQLDKIWRIMGTPTEENWTGVSLLPHYREDKMSFYPRQSLVNVFPRLGVIAAAEELAHGFLQLDPRLRITADDALRDKFFQQLPNFNKLLELPPQASIFSVKGIKLQSKLQSETIANSNPAMAIKPLPKIRH